MSHCSDPEGLQGSDEVVDGTIGCVDVRWVLLKATFPVEMEGRRQ